ncbi:hypothetical protein HXP44_32385 [Streptomyces sioyaensis]|uniref:hypothetical protein n=1 Tax=Streptomyces sioyaensis TaxID=67364 RepID=UPI00142F0C4D|nr:hypothetical protein [Streptomyces sioyaensis]MBM4796598.1 hypothetical protein [Streptomyces sioyaensis]
MDGRSRRGEGHRLRWGGGRVGASELRDFVPVKRIALVAALTHKARMRVRGDLATMFCKRVAMKIKKAKAELEEIRLAEREIVEALIGNYRTVSSTSTRAARPRRRSRRPRP